MRALRLLVCAAVALCLAPSPAATAAAASQRYSGQTDQGLKLRTKADGRNLYLVRVKVRLRCRDGGLLFDDLSDFEPTPLRPSLRFDDVQYGPTDEVHWRGRLTKRTVRGTLRVRDRLENGVRCDSGTVGFVAHGHA